MKIIYQKENITVLQSESGKVNSTVLEYKRFLIIIDTMYARKDIVDLKKFITNLQKPIKFIINTHFHFDHFWGNRFVSDKKTTFIGHKNFLKTATSRVKSDREMNLLLTKNRYPDITFSKKISLENLQIFHCPGHSADSICIYDKKNNLIIAGDTVLGIKNDIKFIPYFVEGTLPQIKNSLEQIMQFDFKVIIPGHFNIVEKSELQKDIDYLEKLQQGKAKITVSDELYKKIHKENLIKIKRGLK